MAKTCVVVLLGLACAGRAFGASIPVANSSFESPQIDPVENPFLAVPSADSWTQAGAANTSGVFYNTPPGHTSSVTGQVDHIDNMDGLQGAFLSGSGSPGSPVALTQVLGSDYTTGSAYTMTVGICISATYAPAANDQLQLAFFYMQGATPVDIQTTTFTDAGLTPTLLVDKTVNLPAVQAGDPWANQPIGIAIQSLGGPNGFWDADNVRVTSAVPEPASVGILSLATAGMLLRRRERR